MEDVEAAAAVPPVQAPPTTIADVAVVLRGLLMLAARGMLCGFLGAMWVSNAANIVWVVARRFGAGGSRGAAVAGDVFVVSALAMILFCPSALLLLVVCLQGPLAEAGEREVPVREFQFLPLVFPAKLLRPSFLYQRLVECSMCGFWPGVGHLCSGVTLEHATVRIAAMVLPLC
jgi:hypothetical protein